jgi:hypothetical protein
MKKRVSILSTFYSIDRAYSLTTVVEDQLKMFVDEGYDIDLIVTDTFDAPHNAPVDGYFAHPKVHLVKIKDVSRSNDGELPDDYEKQAKEAEEEFERIFKDIDVIITHDVIYQPASIIYNIAARAYADKRGSSLRWLHWIHSATSPAIRCSKEHARQIIQSKFPHSFICYPNAGDVPRVARNFGYEEDEVKVVHHSTDIPDYLGFHPLSKRIYTERKLTEADVIAVYPIRLDRGKQVEHVVKTLGAIKRTGRSVRGIFFDFHSTGGDKVVYRQELKAMIADDNLEGDVFFMSEFDPSTTYSVPREVIKDMMLVSNLFMNPSGSETYSLTTQEAAITKNLIYLNQDFPPMKSVWGDQPIYKQFSSAINALTGQDGSTTTKIEDQRGFYHDLAMSVCYYLEHNKVLELNKLVRQKRNSKYVFTHMIEPLLSYTE